MNLFLRISIGFILVFTIAGFTIQKKSIENSAIYVSPCDTSVVYFKEQIMPIMQAKCVSCHNTLKAKEGINVDSYDNIIKTIRVKNSAGIQKNELESVIKTDFMPPGKHEKLTLTEKKLVYKWIQQGMQNNSCDAVLSENNTISEAAITFDNSVKPILDASCISCHNKGDADAGIDLTNMETIKSIAFNGLLMRAVSHSEGVRPMPLNSDKLSDAKINSIQIWINNGMK